MVLVMVVFRLALETSTYVEFIWLVREEADVDRVDIKFLLE